MIYYSLTSSSYSDGHSSIEIDSYLPGMRNIKKYFVNKKEIERYVKESVGGKGFKLPSLIRSRERVGSVCIGSFFYNYNYLLFKDLKSGYKFFIIQHNNGCSGFYLPVEKCIVAPDSMIGFFKKNNNGVTVSKLLDSYAKKKESSPPAKLRGWLDGYPRPYHYFYDRLPSLIRLRGISRSTPVFSLGSTFFPVLGSQLSLRRVDVENINKISLKESVFFYQPFRLSGCSLDDDSESICKLVSSVEDLELFGEISRSSFFIWIGICEEKRKWPGKKKAIKEIILMAKSIFKDPVFIFDGMTSTSFENCADFRKKSCEKDMLFLRSLLEDVGDIKHIDLIGAKSRQKIIASQFVDFFFSSALTDSMWPAHFGFSRGVAYASTTADYSVHNHPLTYVLPAELVKDLDDGVTNWARKGYEINHGELLRLVKEGLIFSKDAKEKREKYGVFGAGGDELVVSQEISKERCLVSCDIKEGEVLRVALYSDVQGFHPDQAFSVRSSCYSFKVSLRCFENCQVRCLVVFYSSEGEEVETLCMEKPSHPFFSSPENASYFKVFLDVTGKGYFKYGGFSAQACGLKLMGSDKA